MIERLALGQPGGGPPEGGADARPKAGRVPTIRPMGGAAIAPPRPE